MLTPRARLRVSGLRVLDLVALGLALWVAHAAGMAGQAPWHAPPPDAYFPLLVTAALLWIAASSLTGLYQAAGARSIGSEVLAIGQTLALAGLGAAVAAPLWSEGVPGAVLARYPISALVVLAGCRLGVRRGAQALRRQGLGTRRFAVAGQGGLAAEVVERFALHPEWGYVFAGYIVEEDAVPAPGCRVLCRLGALGRLLEEQVLDEVVFAVALDRLGAVEPAARLCQQQGITVRICVDPLRGGIAHLESSDIGGLPALAYSTVPSDGASLVVKRVFDVLGSACALALLAPVLIAVAVAIRWESKGPVLFRQRRVGLNGREFDLLKLRSMGQGAEAQLAALQARNEASGPVFKMRNDPRVTRVGRFLRRTSLDEIPQLWNVLRGEMSLVGPRPGLPAEVRQYLPWQRRRLSVRPGITCTWQVSGRSEIPFERWMALDLEYIDSWSLWGDLRILARTIPAVVSARGAA